MSVSRQDYELSLLRFATHMDEPRTAAELAELAEIAPITAYQRLRALGGFELGKASPVVVRSTTAGSREEVSGYRGPLPKVYWLSKADLNKVQRRLDALEG